MTSTAHLLRTVGDQQLRFCPPSCWPATTLTFAQHRSLLVWLRGEAGVMPVCILFAEMAGECFSFQTVFGLN